VSIFCSTLIYVLRADEFRSETTAPIERGLGTGAARAKNRLRIGNSAGLLRNRPTERAFPAQIDDCELRHAALKLAPRLKGYPMRILILATCSALVLAACDSKQEVAEDKMERAAETSATVAGPLPAALGLSEAQLLDADILGPDGKELGEVSQVLRGADDKVDRLLVELDGVGPDRYVHVPVQGLKVVVRGDDSDLQTTMAKAEFDALPQVKLAAP
jgi:hypothetical protein